MNRALLNDQRGAGAAEFALVVPLLILLLFAIIDGGRWMWTYNRAEKATQAGARVAAVTQFIPTGLSGTWVGQNVNGTFLTQGDVIPASAVPTVICTKPAGGTLNCTCSFTPADLTCPGTIGSTGWDATVARMRNMYPAIRDENVEIQYRGSGLGYAGDPGGLDIAPLITVKLKNLSFNAIVTLSLMNLAVPAATTTLTAEDQLGTQSN